MAFVAGRSADAKKIEKKPAADAGNAPDAVAAKEAPKEPARKTPPAGKTPEAKPPPAPVMNVAAAPSASAEGLAAIRKHLDAMPPPAETPSKESTPAEPAPTSVRVDASASSNAPTIAADSVPPPKKDETRKSHITPEEKKAAIAASGPVIDPSSSPSPPKAAKRPAVDTGIKVVLKEPAADAKKSAGDTVKPAPKSEGTEEEPAAKKSGWSTYAIWALGAILGLLVMASILKYVRQGDLKVSADAPAAVGQSKASQMPTAPATAEPAVTPSVPGIVFPREGLPVNAENLNRVFGQTDITKYRQMSEWKKGDPYFCFCTPVDNKDETFNVSACKICKK